VTVIEYTVPFVRFETTIGLVVPVAVNCVTPSGAVADTVYPVISPPFVDEGGENVTVACASPAVAATLNGAEGGPGGRVLSVT